MHLEPNQPALRAFFAAPPDGPVVMLNLLRFRADADYTAHPELASDESLTGRAAYAVYGQHALPFLSAARAEIVFRGSAASYLIGPAMARWDEVLLVRYPNGKAFIDMLRSAGYLAITGHREAALEDSRLLPITAM